MNDPFFDRLVDSRYYTGELILGFLGSLNCFESFNSLAHERPVSPVSFAPLGILTQTFPCRLMIRHLFITSNVPVT